MIRRVILKNFMSHEETVIELADGVTVLTGPNNTGKSAVVEALRCLAENPPSNELIRHGAKKAEVIVELDSGEIIVWERTQNYPQYRMLKQNEEDHYKKVGKYRVPSDIVNILRISPVNTGDGEEVNVHIAHQKDPIFIPYGSKAASFFAVSTEAYYLLRMQQILKAKTDSKRQRKKEIEQEQEKLKELIESLAPLDIIEEKLKLVDDLEKDIKKLEKEIPLLSDMIQKLVGLIEEKKFLEVQNNILEDLSESPNLFDTISIADLIHNMSDIEKHIDQLRQEGSILNLLQHPPELKPVEALTDLITKLDQTVLTVDRLNSTSEIFSALKDPPSLYPVQELYKTIQEHENLKDNVEKLLRENSILESIETVPELNDTAGLESLINEIDMALRNISNLERLGDNFSILIPPPELKPAHEIKALATLIDQIEDMEKRVTKGTAYYADVEKAWKEKRRQIEKRLSEIRICPLCRQPIDIEHFLSELVEYPETSMDVKKISRL